MSREVHVPFYERLGVQFPRPTHRFALSFRDVEDLLAQRSITVTYETVRQWCLTFGPSYARRLKRRQGRLGDQASRSWGGCPKPTEAERQFNEAMPNIYRQAKAEAGYNATRFLSVVVERGGLERRIAVNRLREYGYVGSLPDVAPA